MKENNGIIMNSYSSLIFPSDVLPNIPQYTFRAPLLILLLIKKKKKKKREHQMHFNNTRLNKSNTWKTSYILNSTEQLLILKAHDLSWETLWSTLNSFVAGHSCSPCFFVKRLKQTLSFQLTLS